MVKIAHAVQSENGSTIGAPGDQTGKEVCTAEWYIKAKDPWTYALRPKSEAFASRIVKCAISLADNPHVGYSQVYNNKIYTEGRLSLEKCLRDIDFAYEKLTKDCNCDCSSFVKAVHNCTVTKDNLRIPLERDFDTANAKGELIATNCYKDISDEEHLLTSDELRAGDIVGRRGHIFIVITDGKLEEDEDTASDFATVSVIVLKQNKDNFIEAMRLLGYMAE